MNTDDARETRLFLKESKCSFGAKANDQYMIRGNQPIIMIKVFTFPPSSFWSLWSLRRRCTDRIDSGVVLDQGRVMGAPFAVVADVSYPYLDKCSLFGEATLFCGPFFAFTRSWTLDLPLPLSPLFCLSSPRHTSLLAEVFGHSLSFSCSRQIGMVLHN